MMDSQERELMQDALCGAIALGMDDGAKKITEAIDRLTAAVAHLADTHERVGKLQAMAVACAVDKNGSEDCMKPEWYTANCEKLWAATEKEPNRE